MLEYAASAQVVTFLDRLTPPQRRQLRAALDRMAAHPPHEAPEAFTDHTGRMLRTWRDGEFEVLFWVDHHVRELRIVEVDLIPQ